MEALRARHTRGRGIVLAAAVDQVFPAQSGDRNTQRIGVVVIGALR